MYFTLMSKPIKRSQNASPKTQRNKFFMGQLDNLVLCYRSNVNSHKKISRCFFCCFPYGVRSLLNFMFFFKYEISLWEIGLMWLNTEETLQAATTFIIYNKNKETRLQIISCKLEISCFPFIKMLGNTLHFHSHNYSCSVVCFVWWMRWGGKSFVW